MNPTPYTPEMRERDARIAVAMGWQRVQLSILNATQYAVVPPEWENTTRNQLEFGSQYGRDLYRLVPRFHTDENARRSLLEWLAADDERWMRFEGELDQILDTISLEPGGYKIRQRFMLATPDQVARAADAVIAEGNK